MVARTLLYAGQRATISMVGPLSGIRTSRRIHEPEDSKGQAFVTSLVSSIHDVPASHALELCVLDVLPRDHISRPNRAFFHSLIISFYAVFQWRGVRWQV